MRGTGQLGMMKVFVLLLQLLVCVVGFEIKSTSRHFAATFSSVAKGTKMASLDGGNSLISIVENPLAMGTVRQWLSCNLPESSKAFCHIQNIHSKDNVGSKVWVNNATDPSTLLIIRGNRKNIVVTLFTSLVLLGDHLAACSRVLKQAIVDHTAMTSGVVIEFEAVASPIVDLMTVALAQQSIHKIWSQPVTFHILQENIALPKEKLPKDCMLCDLR